MHIKSAIENQVIYCLRLFGLEIKQKGAKNIFTKVSTLPTEKVTTLIDIGIGTYGTLDLYKFFPNARFIFIDPIIECQSAVKSYLDQNEENIFINTALGSENGEALINVARNFGFSSFLDRHNLTSARKETKEQRQVPIKRLDDVLNNLSIQPPIAIKIDTEGFELEVLKGAPLILKKALIVIVEFHGGTDINPDHSLQDIIDHMVNAGFLSCFMLPDGMNIVFLKNT